MQRRRNFFNFQWLHLEAVIAGDRAAAPFPPFPSPPRDPKPGGPRDEGGVGLMAKNHPPPTPLNPINVDTAREIAPWRHLETNLYV